MSLGLKIRLVLFVLTVVGGCGVQAVVAVMHHLQAPARGQLRTLHADMDRMNAALRCEQDGDALEERLAQFDEALAQDERDIRWLGSHTAPIFGDCRVDLRAWPELATEMTQMTGARRVVAEAANRIQRAAWRSPEELERAIDAFYTAERTYDVTTYRVREAMDARGHVVTEMQIAHLVDASRLDEAQILRVIDAGIATGSPIRQALEGAPLDQPRLAVAHDHLDVELAALAGSSELAQRGSALSAALSRLKSAPGNRLEALREANELRCAFIETANEVSPRM